MKTQFLFKIIAASVIFLTLVLFTSCSEEDDIQPPLKDVPYLSFQAKPEGNSILALDGNVQINFPPGAVESPIEIDVQKSDLGGDENFLLDMISIEPLMRFNQPITVNLKYDSDLVCNEICPENCKVVICHWDREYDFINRRDYNNRIIVECNKCEVNCNTKTVSFTTMESGLYALSIDVYSLVYTE